MKRTSIITAALAVATKKLDDVVKKGGAIVVSWRENEFGKRKFDFVYVAGKEAAVEVVDYSKKRKGKGINGQAGR